MRKKAGWLLAFFLLVFLTWGSQRLSHYVISSSGTSKEKAPEEIEIIIDAGHGGKDGGKIGVNDVAERDVNLAIAQSLQKKLEENKFQVQMTREDENGMADGNIEDLKARVELINKEKPDLVISIHQNSYSDASVKGAQVFYYEHSEEGKQAAEIMQDALKILDESNHREAKANTSYYLLKKTEVPLVIVECGFLSNPEEAGKLVSEEYQELMAEAVFSGVNTYFGFNEN